MAVYVHGWRKPTLTIELVEGGTLLANTLYYVCGMMRDTPQTYNGVSSPMSDVYTITTTATARSIKITQKTYRDISAFANGGTNITTVTSNRHCLGTGDVIKIATGSYTGTWTITKINYNTFTIATAYIDSVPVQCYTDSVRYNVPPTTVIANVALCGMSYYVYTTNPVGTGSWTNAGYVWTDTIYQVANTQSNPLTITVQPTVNITAGTVNLTRDNINNGLFKLLADEYGTILVYADALTTLSAIHTEVQASGFIYNSHYSVKGNPSFFLVGSIILLSTSSLTATGIDITLICGEIFHKSDYTKLVFNNCLINTLPSSFSFNMSANATNSIFYNGNQADGVSGFLYGNNVTLATTLRLSYTNCDIPNQHYTDLITGVIKTYGIVQNKIIKAALIGTYQLISYNQIKFISCETPPLYWILMPEAADTNPNIYMLENVYINDAISNTLWSFRFYTYAVGLPYMNNVKFLNVDTNFPNNIKRCVHNSTLNINALFYRRIEYYIKSSTNTPIQNVIIKIGDSIGTEYTATTDVNGYAYIDYLEQKTSFVVANPIISVWSASYDTYYSIVSTTISKVGYETYSQIESNNLSTSNVITLKTITPNRFTIEGKPLRALSPEMGSSSNLLEL